MHIPRTREAPAGDSHFSNPSAPGMCFLLSALMCSLPRQCAVSRHIPVLRELLCDVKTLQGVQQQRWFLAVSSLPRKHLQWPKIWTQASCAAIPAFVKAGSSQIKKIRQVEASPPYFLLIGSAFKVPSLKEQFAHPAAGKNTEKRSTLRPQEKKKSWIDFFYCFAGELTAIKLSLSKYKSSFLLFPRSNGMALLLL